MSHKAKWNDPAKDTNCPLRECIARQRAGYDDLKCRYVDLASVPLEIKWARNTSAGKDQTNHIFRRLTKTCTSTRLKNESIIHKEVMSSTATTKALDRLKKAPIDVSRRGLRIQGRSCYLLSLRRQRIEQDCLQRGIFRMILNATLKAEILANCLLRSIFTMVSIAIHKTHIRMTSSLEEDCDLTCKNARLRIKRWQEG